MKKGIYLLGLGVLLLLCMDLQAKVRLPHFFSSNMVLQRDMPIRVWGKADKNEVISVALNGSVQTAKTGKDGIWRVELPAMKAGGPYDMQIESAEETSEDYRQSIRKAPDRTAPSIAYFSEHSTDGYPAKWRQQSPARHL